MSYESLLSFLETYTAQIKTDKKVSIDFADHYSNFNKLNFEYKGKPLKQKLRLIIENTTQRQNSYVF